MARKGFEGRSVGVKLRYDDFKIVTRVVTLPVHTQDAAIIRQWAGRCLKTVPLDQRLRLIGVKVENLRRPGSVPVVAQETEAGWRVGESLPLF